MDKKLLFFFLLNILVIIVLFIFTYNYHNYKLTSAKKKPVTISKFLNRGKIPSPKFLAIGFTYGLTFGFIDNIVLWLGLDYIEKYLPGGLLTKSALGNAYSNFLGAIMGTFISIIIADYFEDFNENRTPIWVNSIAILMGCLLGLFTGIFITGKT